MFKVLIHAPLMYELYLKFVDMWLTLYSGGTDFVEFDGDVTCT